MKTIINPILLASAFLAAFLTTGCTQHRDNIDLDGETDIISIVFDGKYNGTPDASAGVINVEFPKGYDLSSVEVTSFELSEGAEMDIVEGQTIDLSAPQTFTVTNGNVYVKYTVNVHLYSAEVQSLTLGGKYEGTISGKNISVFIPYDDNADITSLTLEYELSKEEATADKESGSTLNFSEPVTLTVTYLDYEATYTITVEVGEKPVVPIAFVGIGTFDELGNEARAAADWALANFQNMTYINVNDILNGTASLDGYRMIWCHIEWTNEEWPGVMWDTKDIFNAYWKNGGNMLASRDGAHYINDVWRISKNEKEPNNCFGGKEDLTVDSDTGFSCKGYEEHPLYKDLPITENGMVLLKSNGCHFTNATYQWGIDWEPYFGMDGWKEQTGAEPLASDQNGDANRVTIAEFPSRDGSGKVIVIGTPYFEWAEESNVNNQYIDNLHNLAKNAIDYISE